MDSETQKLPVVMVRSKDAGVFWGKLVCVDGRTVILKRARRVWYWTGAATLSELATKGTSQPEGCKFPAPTAKRHAIFDVAEIIHVTPEALATLDAVPVWTAHE